MEDIIKQLYIIAAYEGNSWEEDLKKNRKLECMIVRSDNIDEEFEAWVIGNCKNLDVLINSPDGFNITNEHLPLLEKFKPQHINGVWYRLTSEHIQYVFGYFDAMKSIRTPKSAPAVTGGNPFALGTVQHFVAHIKETRPSWYCGEEWIPLTTVRTALEDMEGTVSETYFEQVLDAIIPGGYTRGSPNGKVLKVRVKPIYDLCP